MSGCLAVNTETTNATVAITVTHTPSPLATQCFNQQIDDSECNCNSAFIPVIAVAVTVILILCIVIFVVTWKLKHRRVYDGSSNLQMIIIDNGSVSS